MRHRFHALCPYFAMFPESFVQTWLDRLTRPGDLVYDPFCGRGTAPFQALLMGRQAVGSDINPVAYCVSKAKTNAPSASAVRGRLTALERAYQPSSWEAERRAVSEFFHVAYSSETLRQLLFLRSVLRWQLLPTDTMIAALILGALHGESHKSPNILSNRMPRTISTKPSYSVRFWRERGLEPPERDVFEVVRFGIDYRYRSEPPEEKGRVYQSDIRELPRTVPELRGNVRCAVTSPPYLDVTNFEEDQWLRLWFLGGPPHPTYRRVSRDDRHENAAMYWDFISDMWRVLGQLLESRADVVIRLGGKGLDPHTIAGKLLATSKFSGRRVRLAGDYEISVIKGRQTDVFRPGSAGCRVEVDCHFQMA